jgi:hypothetical protein
MGKKCFFTVGELVSCVGAHCGNLTEKNVCHFSVRYKNKKWFRFQNVEHCILIKIKQNNGVMVLQYPL